MENIQNFFLALTQPASGSSEEAHQEHMVKVIALMMAITLFVFSIPISIGWGIISFDRFTIVTLLIIDVLAGATAVLALRGHWKVARIIPIVLFLSFGFYGNYEFGPATTFLLFYVLAVILASIFYNRKVLFVVLLVSIVGPLSMDLLRGNFYLSQEDNLAVYFMVTGLITGIGLTQWYAVAELMKALMRASDYAEELAKEKEFVSNMMKILPVGVCVLDEQGKFTYANQFISEIFGMNEENILQETLDSIAWRVTDIDGNRIPIEDYMITSTEQSSLPLRDARYMIQLGDARKIFISVNATPIVDSGGNFNGVVIAAQNITDSIQAVQALRRSEERFRQIAENVREVFWIGTPDWSEIIYISPTYEYTWGKSVQSLYTDPDSWLESVHEADRENVVAFIEKKIEGDFSEFQFPEYRIVLPDGSLRWISARVFPVLDENGEVYRVTGIAEDITERKLVEEELHENQERYQLATKTGKVGVWDWNWESNQIYVDPNMKTMLGYVEEEIGNDADDWMKLTFPEDVDSVIQVVKDHIEMKTPEFQISYRMLHKDGSIHWFLARGRVIPRETGGLSRVVGTSVDITDRVEMEAAVQESEDRIRSIFRAAPIGIGVVSDRVLLEVNDRICEMVGRSQSELTGQSARIFYPTEEEFDRVGEEKYWQISEKGTGTVETRWQHKDGTIIDVLLSSAPLGVNDLSVGVTFTALDITERKRTQEALAEREATLSSIFQAAHVGIGMEANRVFNEVNDRLCDMTGYSRMELIGKNARMLYSTQEEYERLNEAENYEFVGKKGTGTIEVRWKCKDGRPIDVFLSATPLDENDPTAGLTFVAVDITESKRAQATLAERETTLSGIFRAAPVSISLTREGQFVELNEAMCQSTGHSRAELLGQSPRILFVTDAEYEQAGREMLRQIREKGTAVIETLTARKDGTTYDTLVNFAPLDPSNPEAGMATISVDITESKCTQAALAESEATLRSIFRVAPVNISLSIDGKLIEVNEHMCESTGYKREELVGASVRKIFETQEEFERSMSEISRQVKEKGTAVIETRTLRKDGTTYDALVHFAPLDPNDPSLGQTDVAIDITDRKQHERELETFITLATALRQVDNRNDMIPIILEQTVKLMSGNGATLVRHDADTGKLTFERGIGISQAVTGKTLPVGKGISGLVVETKEPYVCNDLANDPVNVRLVDVPMSTAGIAMPMIAEGEIIGVLWVHKEHAFSVNDVNILTIISEISANALHRTALFENLENSHQELATAYDTTLEGWAKALELRDKETEGHSRNVTELTLQLAKKLGLDREALLHIRRGALLHDIGKMGISDAILLKPGPLNDAEWDIMRQHPVYAYELLSPIPFLEKALDIPYCHHENWDGSGYPRGLKGEEIPLAARIFTLIDYWDALNSDRPYRNAWSKQKILDYIEENKGSIFDPNIATEFLDMIA
ncbi:MAG: PAS domain S-box protein [Anaerolineales bacterium]|nr:PAS domain S-box protein [Anaerolineales bacterium]